MSEGRLDIIGLGPGPFEMMTIEALRLVEAATDLVGYEPYLDRLPIPDRGRCGDAVERQPRRTRPRPAGA